MAIERELAKARSFDVGIEDHGILVMFGYFDYEGGGAQGLGYCIDSSFLYRFLSAFGVEKLRDVEGKSCWVTHDDSTIYKIEPLHKKDGTEFDIKLWQTFVQKLNLPSPYEMRTGKKP